MRPALLATEPPTLGHVPTAQRDKAQERRRRTPASLLEMHHRAKIAKAKLVQKELMNNAREGVAV